MMENLFQKMEGVPGRGFTHGSKFHSDDVFATAFLRILNPEIQVQRGLEVPKDFDGIVYDIGRGRFDHHQEDKEIRENGCPYAAFGLIWREYGAAYMAQEYGAINTGQEEAERFDREFVQALDLTDNTGCANQLADIIDEFNPSWDSEESFDDCFWKAVDFAQQILINHFQAVAGVHRASELVRQAMSECDGDILILPKYVPWKRAVIGSSYQLVVYPSNRGGYSVQGVPVGQETNELVCSLPKSWWGKDAADLPGISGIATLRFCHATGFMAAAETEEDAVLAAKAAIASKFV